jgi:biotin carboxyl carrier protein
MYKVKVNEVYEFDVSNDNGTLKLNNQQIPLDVQTLVKGRSAHVIYNHKSYTIELVEVNEEEKTQRIKVNGNIYTVSIKDDFDLLLKRLGLDTGLSNKIKEIKAPMPGLVLKVLVEEGTEVKKGDNLLVLEAMKMENIIKSPTDGTVKKVFVNQGDKTEKNSVLVQFT